MILCDREIQAAVADGRLSIEPVLSGERYGTTSVDLTLDDHFFKWDLEQLAQQFGGLPAIDTGSFSYKALANAYLASVPLDQQDSVTLGPQEFLLAQTRERVGFPLNGKLAGRVEGKSSPARLGLSVHFAPTLHLTWAGHITLELHNVGPAPIKLTPDAPICQMLVEPVQGEPLVSMEGRRFQDQEDPRGADHRYICARFSKTGTRFRG